jgi:hypothetical protein
MQGSIVSILRAAWLNNLLNEEDNDTIMYLKTRLISISKQKTSRISSYLKLVVSIRKLILLTLRKIP